MDCSGGQKPWFIPIPGTVILVQGLPFQTLGTESSVPSWFAQKEVPFYSMRFSRKEDCSSFLGTGTYSLGFCDMLLVLFAPLQWSQKVSCRTASAACQWRCEGKIGLFAPLMNKSQFWLTRFSAFNYGKFTRGPRFQHLYSIQKLEVEKEQWRTCASVSV